MPTLLQFLELYGGLSAIVLGLNAAAYKLYFLNKKVDLEKSKDKEIAELKSNLNASNLKLDKYLNKIAHVDQSRFDKEFQIYQEVWSSLTHLNMIAEQLKYTIKFHHNIEDIDKRILEFFNLILATTESVQKHSPFYPKPIQQIITKLIEQMQSYAENVSKIREEDNPKLLQWASDHNRVYATEQYLALEEQIMVRLDNLSGAGNV
ncbi:hypothetical protein [uncultured Psychrosphaera sp.]|uniref:hypothetical protein n=1 Tax=uncultured Psychrosphaera sp. TaxID=1403522 RepID=UPI0030F7BAA6